MSQNTTGFYIWEHDHKFICFANTILKSLLRPWNESRAKQLAPLTDYFPDINAAQPFFTPAQKVRFHERSYHAATPGGDSL
jgi:hypothetical protein